MFWQAFFLLSFVCFVIKLVTRESSNEPTEQNPLFLSFQRNYLLVYFLAMEADWLQGPYVYALYESYGFKKNEIGVLFVAGFLSSAVFGTFVGSLADKFGRKRLSIWFGIFYGLSCLTKLVNNYQILMVGRILSGIATSLLFSVFESWMITEHKNRGFPQSLLSDTFSIATFGNSLSAILAGLIATFAAAHFGFVAPFMISLVVLIAVSSIVTFSWTENYGDSSVEISQTFSGAINALKNDVKIPLLGIIQSLFEASMYTFVFMWTPALQAGYSGDLPFGLIFACYMVAIMIGSSIFSVLIGKLKWQPEQIGKLLLFVASLSLLVPVFTTNALQVLSSFLVFEVCCGLYFPCFGTLRGKYIPENTRAAIMNFFRVPLNFLVVLVLAKVGSLANETVFMVCGTWLAFASVLMVFFSSLTTSGEKQSEEVN